MTKLPYELEERCDERPDTMDEDGTGWRTIARFARQPDAETAFEEIRSPGRILRLSIRSITTGDRAFMRGDAR